MKFPHISAALTTLFLVTSALAEKPPLYRVFVVDMTNVAFRETLAKALPRQPEDWLASEAVAGTLRLASVAVVGSLSPAETRALIHSLPARAVRDITAAKDPLTVNAAQLNTENLKLSLTWHIRQRSVTTSAEVFSQRSLCVAFPDTAIADGFKLFIISPQ